MVILKCYFFFSGAIIALDKPAKYTIPEGNLFKVEKICLNLVDVKDGLLRRIKVSAAIVNSAHRSKCHASNIYYYIPFVLTVYFIFPYMLDEISSHISHLILHTTQYKFITPHAQRERGKVIDRGVHIYIYSLLHE